jgi:D-xylose 1-dehydrogenase (NADP+, D-xylono-1,5-lactone-forming)
VAPAGEAVRWGLLSTANINRKVLPGMRASDQVELVAVASRDGDRAAQYARENGIPRAHAGYEALLADPDVEAVYISLPNDGHVPWSRRALEAGKHVLCEKPLTRRAAEVDEVFDVAEKAGRFLVEAFFWRHHPQTRRLAELVRTGAIGELRLMRAVFSHNATPKPGDVRLQADLDGGALMDVGCYCVSGMRLLAGEPAAVTAQQVVGGNGVDVRFAGTLSWDGIVGTLDCGLDLPDRDELELIGSEGTLFLDDPWHGRATGIELRRPEGGELIAVEAADSYRAEVEDLSRAIRGGGEPLLGRADALGQARVIEALYRAAEERREVTV